MNNSAKAEIEKVAERIEQWISELFHVEATYRISRNANTKARRDGLKDKIAKGQRGLSVQRSGNGNNPPATGAKVPASLNSGPARASAI